MISPIPETRYSLILRLPDPHDAEAWEQFVSIYEPLVYRLARARGLQDADAREVVQEVLIAVSGAVERWEPDAGRGRFRNWLFRIARNLMINISTRRKYRSIATGDSRVGELLEQYADTVGEESSAFDLEYRREVFHWAAARVRGEVKDTTWRAFWMSSIEARPVADVAAVLQMTEGAVYVARSRVLGRLRDAVQRLEQNEEA